MKFNATIEIKRSVDEVYAFVCNPRNDVQWRSGVVEAGLTSPTPLQVGTTGYAAAGAGSNNRSDWQIIELAEDDHVTWKFLSGPFAGTGGYRFVGNGDSTTFTLVADIRLRGLRRLLTPLVAWIGPRQNRKDVQKLKELLEEPHRQSP